MSEIPTSDEVSQFESELFADHAAELRQRTQSDLATRDLIGRCSLMIADLLAGGLLALMIAQKAASTVLADSTGVLIIIPVCMVLGLYDRDADVLNKSTFDEVGRLLFASLLVALTTITVRNYAQGAEQQMEPNHLAVMAFAMFGALCTMRLAARKIVRGMTPAERILMIGSEHDHNRLVNAINATPNLKAGVVAHVSTDEPAGENGLPISIDQPDKLQLALSGMRIDRVVIGTAARPAQFAALIRCITATGTKVSLQPQLFGSTLSVPLIEEVGAVKLVNLRQARLSPAAKRTKRMLDISVSTLALLLLAPVFALIAVAIKLDSRGSVFYRQRRIGRDDAPFEIVKFRTMRIDAESEKTELLHLNETAGLFKMSFDPRVTRVGRVLRKTSLDELPQLINVLRAEMSLVGPRPLVPEEDALITGWRRHRSTITPGMTGRWQLLGPVRIPMDEMVELDYEYVTNWSLGTDVKILLQTVPHVLGRRGL